MAHAVQKVVQRCEVAKENGGIMGKKLFIILVSLAFFFKYSIQAWQIIRFLELN